MFILIFRFFVIFIGWFLGLVSIIGIWLLGVLSRFCFLGKFGILGGGVLYGDWLLNGICGDWDMIVICLGMVCGSNFFCMGRLEVRLFVLSDFMSFSLFFLLRVIIGISFLLFFFFRIWLILDDFLSFVGWFI